MSLLSHRVFSDRLTAKLRKVYHLALMVLSQYRY